MLGRSARSPVLVTGASGFLGSAIAIALRARGHEVWTLVRPTSPRTNLDPRDTVRMGDLRDRVSVAGALKGVRYLFHAAADYRLWAQQPEEISRNNVEGTRLIMEEALRAGVERIVYTSSVATLKLASGAAATEDHPLAEAAAIGAYKRSKVAAERLVEAMIRRDGLPAVIVNPSTPIGPRDVRPTPTGRIIIEAASGRMPAFVDTGLNLVHVDDVASGHVAALDRGRIGERYILGGRERPPRRHARRHRTPGRAAAADAQIPRAVVYPIAYGAELVAKVQRRRAVRDAGWPAHGAPSHVLRQFQGAARTRLCVEALRDGLSDAIAWFRCHGVLQMITAALALLSLAVWAYLLFGRGWFWLCGERDDRRWQARLGPASHRTPGPASSRSSRPATRRDVIAASVASLLRQDYRGPLLRRARRRPERRRHRRGRDPPRRKRPARHERLASSPGAGVPARLDGKALGDAPRPIGGRGRRARRRNSSCSPTPTSPMRPHVLTAPRHDRAGRGSASSPR